jgi:hypothetical protein
VFSEVAQTDESVAMLFDVLAENGELILLSNLLPAVASIQIR